MPVFRAEITWGPVTFSQPADNNAVPLLAFSAFDDNDTWGLSVFMQFEEVPLFSSNFENHARFQIRHLLGNDPTLGSFPAGTTEISAGAGDNGAAFLNGGTLAIEKDTDADELRFITPVGTITRTLTEFGMNDLSPLRVHAMGHHVVRLVTTVDVNYELDWTNFYSSEDGTPFRGAAMTAAAPGIWGDFVTVVNAGTPMDFAEAQQATEYHTQIDYDHPGDSPRATMTRRYRVWLGGDTVDAAPGAADSLDAARAEEHGIVFAIYVLTNDAEQVKFRRTHDRGESWEEATVYSVGGTSNTAPTIEWLDGRLYAVWHNGTDILQSISLDLGKSWSTAMSIGITGTNPRLLIQEEHGLQYYFYIDSGALKLLRSGNFAAEYIDASPITVVASLDDQTVAAEIGPDGGVIVGYIASNSWQQVRSSDLGRTWS